MRALTNARNKQQPSIIREIKVCLRLRMLFKLRVLLFQIIVVQHVNGRGRIFHLRWKRDRLDLAVIKGGGMIAELLFRVRLFRFGQQLLPLSLRGRTGGFQLVDSR